MINYQKNKQTPEKTEKLLRKAVKVAAKIKAFPRKMRASELDSIVARATEEDKLYAQRSVRRMYNRLWLIKLGGMTVLILGLILLFVPTSFFIVACTMSIGLGVIIGAAFFGWKTGVFEVHKILRKHRPVGE